MTLCCLVWLSWAVCIRRAKSSSHHWVLLVHSSVCLSSRAEMLSLLCEDEANATLSFLQAHLWSSCFCVDSSKVWLMLLLCVNLSVVCAVDVNIVLHCLTFLVTLSCFLSAVYSFCVCGLLERRVFQHRFHFSLFSLICLLVTALLLPAPLCSVSAFFSVCLCTSTFCSSSVTRPTSYLYSQNSQILNLHG